jgi:hypothetical protein
MTCCREDLRDVMDQIIHWLFGVLGIALAAMGVRQESMLRLVRGVEDRTLRQVMEKIEELRVMHEHPDDYNFGSRETNRLLKESIEQERLSHAALTKCCDAMTKQTNAVNELVRVIREDPAHKHRFKAPTHTGN